MTFLEAQYLAPEDLWVGWKQLAQARQGILADSLAVVSDLSQQLLQKTACNSDKLNALLVTGIVHKKKGAQVCRV